MGSKLRYIFIITSSIISQNLVAERPHLPYTVVNNVVNCDVPLTRKDLYIVVLVFLFLFRGIVISFVYLISIQVPIADNYTGSDNNAHCPRDRECFQFRDRGPCSDLDRLCGDLLLHLCDGVRTSTQHPLC